MNSNFIYYEHEFCILWDMMSMNLITMLIGVFIEIWTCTACISEPEAFFRNKKKRRNSWKICNRSCYIILLLETKFIPTL